jgi:CBS domain-containing protein
MTRTQGLSPTLGDHARDLLRPAVIVPPDAPLRTVAATLWQASVGAAVVGTVDRPLGILSERDIVTALGQAKDPDTVTAAEAMTAPVVAARTDDRLVDVAYLMFDDMIRHVPILDEFGHVSGIVSVRDLLRPLLLDALGSL